MPRVTLQRRCPPPPRCSRCLDSSMSLRSLPLAMMVGEAALPVKVLCRCLGRRFSFLYNSSICIAIDTYQRRIQIPNYTCCSRAYLRFLGCPAYRRPNSRVRLARVVLHHCHVRRRHHPILEVLSQCMTRHSSGLRLGRRASEVQAGEVQAGEVQASEAQASEGNFMRDDTF